MDDVLIEEFEGWQWHGSKQRGTLRRIRQGGVRSGMFTTSDLGEAIDYSGVEYLDPEDAGELLGVYVSMRRAMICHGRRSRDAEAAALRLGLDGVVVHYDANERDPSAPTPARTWVIILDPGSVRVAAAPGEIVVHDITVGLACSDLVDRSALRDDVSRAVLEVVAGRSARTGATVDELELLAVWDGEELEDLATVGVRVGLPAQHVGAVLRPGFEEDLARTLEATGCLAGVRWAHATLER